MNKPFILVLAIGAAFVWWTSGAMPQVVASHFVADGAANGFMPRGQYAGFMLALVVAVPSIIFIAGGLARRVPVRFVNLPNKQYWLAPERQVATLASLGAFGAWAAYATLGILCLAHWFVFRANLAHPPRLEQSPFIAALALFFAALFIGMLVVLRRFFRVPG
jgi:hypothetical protein